LFKDSLRKRLKFFIEHRIVENTPESIADYLFNTTALDPAGIGQILGGDIPQESQIFRKFVKKFDGKRVSFESAFRQFLY
jgi:Sec7-like guanine-nucleotide exchange factor